ncbi:MAG: hypothetical protein EOS58_18125 [Mesorhizobium sp.]|nr:hypothetical protein EJ073_08655 [Mesorhizobium sp. M4B.F.Ca.ET.058.02.1.1]RUX47993.1 hypothetical protein EOA33_16865 [Mesorhizobium sp. M4A.F.Ca.ET.050.02.1.1]RVC43844.1 hypothetical protein EN781_16540 [Mesorhizobium sp. M4A.F.Ca.ET.090.04.2.1]RVC75233.1 hypothetical protein EN745_28030 [Mesorhizobium sp. M4A.F.Ca.ET.022.05.2.1]RVD38963.1 hypothetical protein EN742_16335 [Mesorhizobium sp. M4A.F.Ca.ET.020.02.1.1]RVD68586.1 hypothetical protein EN751_30605 [Mesorhizobium sp. M4A.F.Ca.ET.0
MEQSTRLGNLHFAQAMLREVRERARSDGEDLLTYLIDMAYLEASDRIRAIWAAKDNDAASGEGR